MRQNERVYEEFIARLVSYLRDPEVDGFDTAREVEIRRDLRRYEQDAFFRELLDRKLQELFNEYEENAFSDYLMAS
jgi:hypothetical protein